MYHIKDDKRSRASAAAIVKGLQECLSTMPMNAVTVTDIHRSSGVSRATFYRLFDTPEDVLHYQFDQMALEIQDQTSPELHLEQMIAQSMRYHELIHALVDNRRLDLLFEYTEKSFQNLDARHILFPESMDPMEQEYILTHLSISLVGILITWLRHGCRETPAQLAGYMKKCIKTLYSLMEEGAGSLSRETSCHDSP